MEVLRHPGLNTGPEHSTLRGQELCESGGDRPGLLVPNSPCGLCGRKATLDLNTLHSEVRSCVKVEVTVLGSSSLIVLVVSLDVKQHRSSTDVNSVIFVKDNDCAGKRIHPCMNMYPGF